MADYRQIHTKIWKDNWFLGLEPLAKLLWVYLFSNERASVAGIYELPLPVIVFETGLNKEYCIDTLSEFEAAGKIQYSNGVVWVINLRKYNENKSPKVQTRIRRDFEDVPDGKIKRSYAETYGMDTVSIPYLKTNSEQEQEQEQEQEGSKKKSPRPPMPKPENPTEEILVTHPATLAWMDAGLQFPGMNNLRLIIERLGETPNLPALDKARSYWSLSGYNPNNHIGILEWYDNIRGDPAWEPAKRFAKNGQHPAGKQETTAERVERIKKMAGVE